MTAMTSEWISRKQYEEQLTRFGPDGVSIYHRLPWLDALTNGFGATIRFVRSADRNGETVAITPFMCKRKGPFHLVGTPLSGMYTEFAGPLFRPELPSDAVSEVMASLHRLAKKDGDYVEWGGKGNQAWGSMLERLGYSHTTRPTLLVDLSPGEAAVWSSFEGRARNMTRKAEKAGVVATVQERRRATSGEVVCTTA